MRLNTFKLKIFILGKKEYYVLTHWIGGIISLMCWGYFLLGGFRQFHTTHDAIGIAIGIGLGVVSSFHFAFFEKSWMKWLGWISFSLFLNFILLIILNQK